MFDFFSLFRAIGFQWLDAFVPLYESVRISLGSKTISFLNGLLKNKESNKKTHHWLSFCQQNVVTILDIVVVVVVVVDDVVIIILVVMASPVLPLLSLLPVLASSSSLSSSSSSSGTSATGGRQGNHLCR